MLHAIQMKKPCKEIGKRVHYNKPTYGCYILPWVDNYTCILWSYPWHFHSSILSCNQSRKKYGIITLVVLKMDSNAIAENGEWAGAVYITGRGGEKNDKITLLHGILVGGRGRDCNHSRLPKSHVTKERHVEPQKERDSPRWLKMHAKDGRMAWHPAFKSPAGSDGTDNNGRICNIIRSVWP